MTTTTRPETYNNSPAPQPPLRRLKGPMPDGPIIQVRNVAKQFGKDKMVVQNLNFEVQAGQIFCLLGASGSGKSTTLRMLTGLYRPTEGEVRVFGQEPDSFRKRWRQRMGYMPQQFVLFPEISVRGNVNFVASVYGMSWFKRSPKIRQALEFVNLWDSRDKLASQLSGGMQRRLQLAATLIHNPELIFVDEPTAGIDPMLRSKFWDHFRELRDQGRTLFVTTQYVTEADYCDVVAILNRGRLLAIGAPEEIRKFTFGGEIINLSMDFITSQAVQILRQIPGVKHVQFLSTEDLKLTVADSAETLPLIVEAMGNAQITLRTIEPYRPDFEEVFVRLMEQDKYVDEEEDGANNHGKNKGKDKDKDKDRDKAKNLDPQRINQQVDRGLAAQQPGETPQPPSPFPPAGPVPTNPEPLPRPQPEPIGTPPATPGVPDGRPHQLDRNVGRPAPPINPQPGTARPAPIYIPPPATITEQPTERMASVPPPNPAPPARPEARPGGQP